MSASDDPEVQRIIPVWAKNLENASKHQEQIERDSERSFRELETRREVSGKYEILTASFVDIVPEGD